MPNTCFQPYPVHMQSVFIMVKASWFAKRVRSRGTNTGHPNKEKYKLRRIRKKQPDFIATISCRQEKQEDAKGCCVDDTSVVHKSIPRGCGSQRAACSRASPRMRIAGELLRRRWPKHSRAAQNQATLVRLAQPDLRGRRRYLVMGHRLPSFFRRLPSRRRRRLQACAGTPPPRTARERARGSVACAIPCWRLELGKRLLAAHRRCPTTWHRRRT
jgi:hypothetical protein